MESLPERTCEERTIRCKGRSGLVCEFERSSSYRYGGPFSACHDCPVKLDDELIIADDSAIVWMHTFIKR